MSSSTAAATRSARNVIYRGVVTEGVEVTSKESQAKKPWDVNLDNRHKQV